MLVFDVISALIIALVIAVIFSGLGRQGPWASFWIFFFVLFLAVWAGGIWFRPAGPTMWGFYWIPFLCVGLLFALILAAATPPRRPPRATEGRELPAETGTDGAALALEAFFWIWVAVLVFLIFGHYAWW